MVDLSAALRTALEAVEVARQMLLAECARPDGPRGEIGHCPADDEAEWAIRERLLSAFPAWGFLGEETPARAAADTADHVWIVDPNDGTTSMQRGYRGHAVSVGLVCGGVPVLGIVCAVDAPDDGGDLIFWAEGCGPLRHNGVAVAPRRWERSLQPADVVCLSQGANRNPVGYLACVAPARFVSLPSIAYRLALVASGDYAATVSLNSLSAWDYAAGHALLRGVGGVLADATGAEITYARDGRAMRGRVFAGGPDVVRGLVRRPWQQAGGSGFGDAVPPPDLAPVRARVGALVHDVGVLRRSHGCMLGQLGGSALGGPDSLLDGQPTGASELALMLARALVVSGQFDREAVAAADARWSHGWTHTEPPQPCNHPWCQPFDVGSTTTQPLARIGPLGIWGAYREPSEVAAAAWQIAQPTHPHPVCQAASAVFAVSLAAAIRDGLDPQQTYEYALAWSRTTDAEPSITRVLEASRNDPPHNSLSQQGWVLVALQNAFFQLLHAPDLEAAVVATVRAGGDADTNAAVCGALVGAVYGRDAVPAQWQHMVLSCRPMPGQPGVQQPRPALFWPTDALLLAERLAMSGRERGS